MRPAEASWFANAGLQTPEDFLALPGEIVGGHPDRHVLRVEINSGEEVRGFYLKREHRTRWHERGEAGGTASAGRRRRFAKAISFAGLPMKGCLSPAGLPMVKMQLAGLFS